jgi:hypothetical protein
VRDLYALLAPFILVSITCAAVWIITSDLPLSSSMGSTVFVAFTCYRGLGRKQVPRDSEEWQHFYSILASRLELKSSPERAFEAAAEECRNMSISRSLDRIAARVREGGSLSRCLLEVHYGDSSSRKLAILAASALGNDSVGACRIIRDFVRLLRRNAALSKEREQILKEGRFKATILALTNTISIAILAGISPTLQRFVSGSGSIMGHSTIAPSNFLGIAFLASTLSSSLLLSRGFKLSTINAMTVCSLLAYIGTYLLLRAIF